MSSPVIIWPHFNHIAGNTVKVYPKIIQYYTSSTHTAKIRHFTELSNKNFPFRGDNAPPIVV